jgi:hypothetical protein
MLRELEQLKRRGDVAFARTVKVSKKRWEQVCRSGLKMVWKFGSEAFSYGSNKRTKMLAEPHENGDEKQTLGLGVGSDHFGR